MPETQVLRAYRFALDPTDAERATLSRYAGACRWAYNYALAKKTESHQAWMARRARYLDAGLSEAEAKSRIKADGAGLTDRIKVWDHHRRSLMATTSGKQHLAMFQPPAGQEVLDRRLAAARADAVATGRESLLLAEARTAVNSLKAEAFRAGFRTPSAMDTSALWRMDRDRPAEAGGSPWWGEVNVYCFTSGFDRAQAAWKNWLESLSGRRAGRRAGYPRFKTKGRAAESFALFHDVKRPIIRLDGYRRLVMPGLGSIRIHGTGKTLARLVGRGRAVIQSVTLTRGGHRWYACVLAKVLQDIPLLWEHIDDDGVRTPYLTRAQADTAAERTGRVKQVGRPTARQRSGGPVGVDLGSRYLALSSPLRPGDPSSTLVEHPRLLTNHLAELTKRQRALARTAKGSRRRAKAADRLVRVHHQIAVRRASSLHGVSKQLATGFTHVVIEDLDLVALSASDTGVPGDPGRDVKIKARWNRNLLDAGLGELRRQLAYKTIWYGSQLVVLDKGEPVAGTCAKCAERNPSSAPSRSGSNCPSCGAVPHRHDHSTANIVHAARRQLKTVASDRGETLNARRASVSPGAHKGSRQAVSKREGTG
ncbi:transposase [Streptomyces sp. RKAG290]|uniref:transposase n=1 Tax=Streptomyces sp. RKAG290 TaxID=2888348 RepID=UPI002033442D|nr:transposase [Streptomyces sp. RKAG290]MCM2412380.1 transposase [Streptomyces sp. RKAG290]